MKNGKILGKWISTMTVAAMLMSIAIAGGSIGPAPDFSLTSRDGSVVQLSSLKGNVVLINFWATWCAPCRQEMPLLDAIYQKYNHVGFEMLGINVENDAKGAERYLTETPVTFPILFDPTGKVSKQYNVKAMPSTVLVDRQGNVRHVHFGYKPGYENDYQDQIRALVRER